MKAIDADIRCEPIPMAGLDLLQRCLPPNPHCQLGREFGISDRRKQIVERREPNCAIDVQQAEILGVGIRRSEEHTSELQSLMRISYAVFCLKKKKYNNPNANTIPINHIHNT